MWGLQRRWFLKRGRSSTLLASQRSKAVFLMPLAVHDLCDMWTTAFLLISYLNGTHWNSFYSNVLPKRSLPSLATRKDLKRLHDCFLTGQPRAHHREECGELRRNHVSIRMHLIRISCISWVVNWWPWNNASELRWKAGWPKWKIRCWQRFGRLATFWHWLKRVRIVEKNKKIPTKSSESRMIYNDTIWYKIYMIYNLDYHLDDIYIYYIYIHNLCNDTPRAGHQDWRRKLYRHTENRVGLGLRIHRKKHRKKHQIHLRICQNLLESVGICWNLRVELSWETSGCSGYLRLLEFLCGRLWPLRSWNSPVRYASTPVRPLEMSPWHAMSHQYQ